MQQPSAAAGAATGYPRWQAFAVGPISVDGLVWSSICLLLHGYALISLLLDERRIKFRSTDEEQLWRFFYRRSGMGRLEMKEVGSIEERGGRPQNCSRLWSGWTPDHRRFLNRAKRNHLGVIVLLARLFSFPLL